MIPVLIGTLILTYLMLTARRVGHGRVAGAIFLTILALPWAYRCLP